MPEVGGVTADHHKYVIEGMIDGDVVRKQSEDQLSQKGETSYVHYHKYNEPCKYNKHTFYGNV